MRIRLHYDGYVEIKNIIVDSAWVSLSNFSDKNDFLTFCIDPVIIGSYVEAVTLGSNLLNVIRLQKLDIITSVKYDFEVDVESSVDLQNAECLTSFDMSEFFNFCVCNDMIVNAFKNKVTAINLANNMFNTRVLTDKQKYIYEQLNDRIIRQ